MTKHKILPIMATAILAGAMFFAGCEKEKKTETGNINVSNVSFTSCISHRVHNQDSIVVSTNNGTIYVTHYNLEVNCGFEKIDVNTQISGDTIIVTERGVPDNTANCLCDVNNLFQLNNVPQGRYLLQLFNEMNEKMVFEKFINM